MVKILKNCFVLFPFNYSYQFLTILKFSGALVSNRYPFPSLYTVQINTYMCKRIHPHVYFRGDQHVTTAIKVDTTSPDRTVDIQLTGAVLNFFSYRHIFV